jgi:acyl carrier protein
MSLQQTLARPDVTDTQILEHLRAVLSANFEIRPECVTPEAGLFSDLDLDSIDAVDLAIKLQELTGRRVTPQEFKGIRTVGDVIGTVKRLLAA